MSRRITTVFLLVGLFCLSEAGAQEISLVAMVEPLKGTVKIQAPGSPDQDVTEIAEVPSGTIVTTSAQSEAIVRWANGNVIKMSSFTTIRIDNMTRNPVTQDENSSLFMWNGDVTARAKTLLTPASSLELSTPQAIAGVRGTRFRAQVTAKDESQFWCTEGMIEVKAMGVSMMVSAGVKTRVKQGEAPEEPEPITLEEEKAIEEVEEIVGPSIEVDAPVGNLVATETPIMVKGHTSSGNSVMIQGVAAAVGPDGGFEGWVDLELGANQVKIMVANDKGGRKTITRAVKYRPEDKPGDTEEIEPEDEDDTTAPALTITTPASGTRTRSDQITIIGKTEPGAKVTAGGAQASVSSDGSFQATVRLMEGENNILVQASDAAGNMATESVTVTKDTTPPMLIITDPTMNFSVGSSTACELVGTTSIRCRVTGITEAGAILKINDVSYSVETDGSFRAVVSLSYTASQIKVEVADDLGNRKSVILTRSVDYEQPIFVTVTPGAGTIISDGQATVSINVTVKNFMGEAISGASVSVSLSQPSLGTFSPSSGTTNSSGQFTTILMAGTSRTPITGTITALSGDARGTGTIMFVPDTPQEPE